MAREPINEMPGWVWQDPTKGDPGHGFRGRHAYRTSDGASISLRQAQAVQRHQQTVEQALAKAAKPRKSETINFAPRGKPPRYYRVKTFGTLYGAYLYATERTTSKSFIIAQGYPYKLYPNEDRLTYRTLHGLNDPSGHKANGIQNYYARFDSLMTPAKTPSYYVWEKSTDVSTYRPS